MEYGLIGEKLGHSFSKIIHEQLADYSYDLMPLNHQEFKSFMEQREFTAINVTIPYKQAVIPYLDHMDTKAEHIQAVNTILKKDGKLYGTNTDYDGFWYTLKKHQINVKDKKVLICGDGGAAQAVKAVLQDEGCREIISIRRTKTAHTITYEEACAKHHDCQIIVNTSPCGMYPNHLDRPLDLAAFPDCEAVVDLIYNPLQTRLCVQAKKRNIRCAGGLEMLVAQAKYAVEFFKQTKLADTVIDTIVTQLMSEKRNIVLIGMPSCGKTTIAQALAKRMNREVVDLDEMLVDQQQKSIKTIMAEGGEAEFRRLESEVVKQISKQQGLIIATGGGVIKNPANPELLSMNGTLFYIKRPIEQLLVDDKRPLSSSTEAIAALWQERKALYERYADFVIENNADIEQAVTQIISAFTYKK